MGENMYKYTVGRLGRFALGGAFLLCATIGGVDGCAGGISSDTVSASNSTLLSIHDFLMQNEVSLTLNQGSYNEQLGSAIAKVPVREGSLILEIGLQKSIGDTLSTGPLAVTFQPAQIAVFYGLTTSEEEEAIAAANVSDALTDPGRRSICSQRQLVAPLTLNLESGEPISTQLGLGLTAAQTVQAGTVSQALNAFGGCASIDLPYNCGGTACNVTFGTGSGGGTGACTAGWFIVPICYCKAGAAPGSGTGAAN